MRSIEHARARGRETRQAIGGGAQAAGLLDRLKTHLQTTLGVSLALLTFLEAPSQRRAVVVGLASGAALLTRHLGLVLLVVAIAVVVMLLFAADAPNRIAINGAAPTATAAIVTQSAHR